MSSELDSSSDSSSNADDQDERQLDLEESLILEELSQPLSKKDKKKEYDRLRNLERKAIKDVNDPKMENKKRRPGAGRKRKYPDSYVFKVDENGNNKVDENGNGIPAEKRLRSKSTPRNPALEKKKVEIRSKVRALTKNLRMNAKAEIESLKKESINRGIQLPSTKQEYCNILNVVSLNIYSYVCFVLLLKGDIIF